ncbi:MAG TPA: hypothetical protein VHX66_01445 [Solirubrobacteraceae bacterium]|jgi:hypothetical protein|nr:hypothetical protein [Solirubrobacteraceae bacterium]
MARGPRRPRLRAQDVEYTDGEGGALVLRGSLSLGTRGAYARIENGQDLPPGASREDGWQRAFEFLFERLVVSWTIAGTEPLRSQRELLGRLRFASSGERAWLRERLREHCAAYFPDVHAP